MLDVIEGEGLIENAKAVGAHLLDELKKLPQIKEVRGRGLMIGMEFEQPIKELRSRLLHEQKVFTGVSGTNVIRLLPPLCLSMDQHGRGGLVPRTVREGDGELKTKNGESCRNRCRMPADSSFSIIILNFVPSYILIELT